MVTLIINNVKWKCKVTKTTINTVVKVSWSPLDRTLEFNSLAESIRKLAMEKEWLAEELATEIACMVAKTCKCHANITLLFRENDEINVEIVAAATGDCK